MLVGLRRPRWDAVGRELGGYGRPGPAAVEPGATRLRSLRQRGHPGRRARVRVRGRRDRRQHGGPGRRRNLLEAVFVAAVDAAATTANAESRTGSPRRPAMMEGTRTWTIRSCGRTENSRRTASRINCLRPSGACVRQAPSTVTLIAVAREGENTSAPNIRGVERSGSPVPGGSVRLGGGSPVPRGSVRLGESWGDLDRCFAGSVRPRASGDAGRGELAGARVPGRRRHAPVHGQRLAGPTSPTPTAASTSTWSARGARSILGHAHPAVVQAVAARRPRGTSFGTPTAGEVELAEEIVRPGRPGRAGAAGQLRHRGDHERDPAGPRLHRPRQGGEVRRLLSRPRRRAAGQRRSAASRPSGCPTPRA